MGLQLIYRQNTLNAKENTSVCQHCIETDNQHFFQFSEGKLSIRSINYVLSVTMDHRNG